MRLTKLERWGQAWVEAVKEQQKPRSCSSLDFSGLCHLLLLALVMQTCSALDKYSSMVQRLSNGRMSSDEKLNSRVPL